jgi:hypothetical protein
VSDRNESVLPPLDPERVAMSFHWHYERLAARFDYTTRKDSAVPWDQVPAQNRALMVETASCVLRELQGLGYLTGEATGG